MKKKAVVALSGGVDSALAAALLLEQGYEVVGLTMAVVPQGDGSASLACAGQGGDNPAPREFCEAREVADSLQIPLHTVGLEKSFREMVIGPFLRDYLDGRTPNPCALCNRCVKFGLLREKALALGGDLFATGHYARIRHEGDRHLLFKGIDRNKDQSYFLFGLHQAQLAGTVFPLGGLTKGEVRQRAAGLGLSVSNRGESQDICFVPDQDYIAFLEREAGVRPLEGDIVYVSGQVLGRHRGSWRYTVGQRKGLGIAWSEPLYVVRIDAPGNRVVVGERSHLGVARLKVRDLNWIAPPPSAPFSCRCRIRYRHREAPARVVPQGDGTADIQFELPQEGVTPGQAAVFFEDELVLGGGWIV